MAIAYFIVLVGVLIFVHELGHFAWAKLFGVKVLKFSLGFGPRIFGFSRGETEYVVAAFPLGGYVRLLGEGAADVVRPEDEGRAFSQQPLYKRVVIVFAGPAMNLALPIVIFFVVFLGDASMTPATIGMVFPDRPADGVLEAGDRVVAVNGDEVETFYELARAIGDHPGERVELEVERDGERQTVELTPFLASVPRPLDLREDVGRIGVTPFHPLAVVGVTSPSSPAAAARLRTFDRVIAAAGRPVERWVDLDEALGANRGSMVPLTYLRPSRLEDALGGLVELEVYEPHVATITPEPGPGSGLVRAGIEPSDLYVSHVTLGSPEHRIGVRPGDRLVELDGRPIRAWATFIEDLDTLGPREHVLTWRRGDQLITHRYRLEREQGTTSEGQPYDRYTVGMRHFAPSRLDPPVDNPSRISYALGRSFSVTAELVEITVVSVVRLLQGRLSVRTIGGPIRIFEATEAAAREGAFNYLSLMAFISINLGLINLLPIPMLDGGHLVFIVIEAVARRPVSVRVRQIASLAGLVLLILLMLLAFTNDIGRQWPRVVEAFEAE
ncbi:MAG: RIP metalloprotease RseP [Sandaracinaceae bacterium]|nr:RIP metalloprotease RseP [Sandaracinaceae bacterium]